MITGTNPWQAGGGGLTVTSPAAWLDAVNTGFLPLEVDAARAGGFWGQIDSRQLGDIRLALVSSQAHRVRRTGTLVERAERNHLKALWLMQGRCEVEQGDNRSALEAGQWVVYETGRPYSIRFAEPARFAVALLPIETCADWRAFGEQLCARALQVDAAARGALYTLLSTFDSPAGGPGLDAVGRALGLMLSDALMGEASAFMPPPDRLERRLGDARRFIQAHLADPGLGPRELAAALNVSLRSVHSLFRPLGMTPAAFIQAARLERSKSELADSSRCQRTITEIALANGFADSAHFSRLFRARFGMTPSDWRLARR